MHGALNPHVKWTSSLKFCIVWCEDTWSPTSRYGEAWVELVCNFMEQVKHKDIICYEYWYKTRGLNFVGLGSDEGPKDDRLGEGRYQHVR